MKGGEEMKNLFYAIGIFIILGVVGASDLDQATWQQVLHWGIVGYGFCFVGWLLSKVKGVTK